MGLSVVSACSRECRTVCDSHGCSWVGYGAGGRSGAPQQPHRLTPIQFDTSILTVEPKLQPVISRADWHLRSSSWAVLGSLGGVLEGGKRVLHEILTGGQPEHRENSGPQLIRTTRDFLSCISPIGHKIEKNRVLPLQHCCAAYKSLTPFQLSRQAGAGRKRDNSNVLFRSEERFLLTNKKSRLSQ